MRRPALQQITIGEQITRTALAFPGKTALVWKDQRLTYQELDSITDNLAAGLLAWGMKLGDVLGIWCETEPANVLMMYAAEKIGVIAAMINTSLQEDEAKDIIDRSDVRFLAISAGYKDVSFAEAAVHMQPVGMLEKVFTLGDFRYEGLDGMAELLEAGKHVSPDALTAAKTAVQPSDCATMLYTSGTTSKPKIVRDTHYSRMNLAIQQACDLHCTSDDVFCVAMPLFHCFCISVNTLACLSVGGTLVLCPDRHTDTILNTIVREKCTVLHCVPTLFHALICRDECNRETMKSLRCGYIGGSLYPPELFVEIEEKIGFKLMSSLGQTEACAGLTTCNPEDSLEVRAHSVGHFIDHLEYRIVDPQSGRVCGKGEMGEICIRGYSVMQGYHKAPESTAKAIDAEGFLHTGDMGYVDEHEYLYLTGRLKDLIIRGGENISPAEIENAAAKDSRVHECRAIGVPDAHYGEEVCLCVQLKDGAQCTAEELRCLLKGLLAHYKVPRYIQFVQEFPRTNTGKIRTAELAKQIIPLLK